MTTSKLTQNILRILKCDIINPISINQIAVKLNKTYPNINRKVTYLIEQDILKKIIIGRSYLCSLNLDNELTLLLLSVIDNDTNNKDLTFLSQQLNLLSKHENFFSIKNNKTIYIISDKIVQLNLFKKNPFFKNYELKIITKKEFKDFILKNYHLLIDSSPINNAYEYYRFLSTMKDELMLLHSPLITR